MKHSTRKGMFWSFPISHFSYFFIWAIVSGYLTLWLEQVANLNGSQAGIIFSMMAAMSLVFQPIFGFFSDKLVMKKNLVFVILGAGLLIGPYFEWAFMPLLSATNSFSIAVITGIYLSFVLNGGVSVIEQYIQRASITNQFEFGHSRIGGSIAGAVASFVGGRLFLINPNLIFWAATGTAMIAIIMFAFFDKINLENVDEVTDVNDKISMSDVRHLFKLRNFWVLGVFFMGASALYDVFDQQFVIFFQTFFPSVAHATTVYSNIVTIQMVIEILLMIPMPYIINKIGARNGLIIYGFITAIRIIGTALAPNWIFIVILRLMAGFEMPLVLVSIMKYINGTFDNNLYATIYALAANFMKQISVFIFSALAGHMYDSIGFQHTYLLMGSIVLIITIFTAFLLENDHGDKKTILREESILKNPKKI
ncbi:oligosaccharide MFS transporter [Leuconostoc gelidum]|uniref:oligosaccharide MFS transporter n=1 Tax=Leuconostoc gelidum TaxID=1244 RepID=UPI0002191F55|nr:oligosaccharide MFS transporter [Leuconostoc gelidum]AFS40459.1 Sugar-proton symporter [Leuconostoc gelidum JB7]MBZ5978398.1 oligosaccharide MFS transporter [Leuconostoc gelidum subsp. gelidum]MBZ5992718.1 oligosaccharide MFS transporter [Leuconostoc gelidum subsp. gelidum]MBZ6013855.1 oligosaccharide MFS transporter [Leuconostoc gelidum subsp. gelidum]USP18103.1 oligosaccharide MFS transporter [Leuconostoc gelidum subsp. aenigmaticum]